MLRNRHDGDSRKGLPLAALLIASSLLSCTRQPAAPPTEEVPTPLPALEKSTSEPPIAPTPEATPVIEATPVPTPVATPTPLAPLTLSDVVQNRSLWPTEIALTKPALFPLALNGKVIGTATRPAGSIVRVIRPTLQGVEVSFNNTAATIPATSTDLMARATKLRSAAKDIIASATMSGAVAPNAASTPARTVPASVIPSPVIAAGFLPPSKLSVEIIRIRRSRIEGGDWDDKIDHIRLKAKVSNTDPQLSTAPLKATIFVFADSIIAKGHRKLLGRGLFDLQVNPRSEKEFTTSEFDTAYDTTGARFGYKYGGWILDVCDASGKTVFSKASAPSLEKALSKIASMQDKSVYDQDFKPTTDIR